MQRLITSSYHLLPRTLDLALNLKVILYIIKDGGDYAVYNPKI